MLGMRKVYYYFEGGLGDVIIQFFENRHISGLADYKDLHDCAYAKAILNVHNSQTADLFRYNSEFDEIQVIEFDAEMRQTLQRSAERDGYIHWGGVHPSGAPPRFALSASDQEYLQKVLPSRAMILLHLGSGRPGWRTGRVNLPMLIDAADRRDATLVMVGGTSMRGRRLLDEPMPLVSPHAALVNLVGAANPRLVCEIARRASGFIGFLGCYMWAAALQGKPAVALVPDNRFDDYLTRARATGAVLRNFSEIGDNREFYDSLVIGGMGIH